MGPRRSHFWDGMHSLVKEQKKNIFTVPFLGPSGGTKNETAKSQNQQQRPTRPNKNTQKAYKKTEEPTCPVSLDRQQRLGQTERALTSAYQQQVPCSGSTIREWRLLRSVWLDQNDRNQSLLRAAAKQREPRVG